MRFILTLRQSYLKKFTLPTLCLIAVSASAAWTQPHVDVSGQGIIEAKPQLLQWSISIENYNPDIAQLSKLHQAKVAEALQTISKLGVERNDVQTSRIRLDEHFTRKNNSTVKDGYKASTQISFKLRDIKKYHEVWLALSKIDGIRIQNATWGLPKDVTEALKKEARLLALDNAKEKANALSKALEMKIGSPLLISEPTSHQSYPRQERAMMVDSFSSKSGQAYAAGMITISASINVVFEMLPMSEN